MSLRALLDRLEARVGNGWQRSTGVQSLAKIVEIGQDQLIDSVIEKRTWIDPANEGFPPYLKTVDGTNQYDIIAANLKDITAITKSIGGSDVEVVAEYVTRIFVDVTSNFDYRTLPFDIQNEIGYYTTQTSRLKTINIPVRMEPALENTPARVIFPFNPGTHDDHYFCEFVWEAPRIISEFTPLVVPMKFELALEEFVVGYCQEFEHGGISDYILTFFSKKRADGESWVDKYDAYMQRGAQYKPRNIQPRIF